MSLAETSLPVPPSPRHFGAVNWIGVWTMYRKEVQRFFKVVTQTVLAPIVTTLLFLAVFALAMPGTGRDIGGIHYVDFLAPGLIMMAIAQNAFANASSSIVIAKVQGNIVDILMPPLSPGELLFGFAAGGVTRGLVVGLATFIAMMIFVVPPVHNIWAILYFALAAALMLSLLGILGGIWSEKFDHMAAVTNFVITPLAFLSGTFYSVERLPEFWRAVSHVNPFFFMIDGFRYGFIGRSDGPLLIEGLALAAVDLALATVCLIAIRRGWRLRA